jgi:2-polyprenyl-3-methyl-5-hydroxy-6-metoxy-1,4-benzoquinol methylase
MAEPQQHHKPPSTPAEWDERYLSAPDRIWSGEPNPSLVAEISELPPGRALDLGCGEGGDAIWLAKHGWQVTGIDLSPVAIGRATEAARAAGVEVEWIAGDSSTAPLPPAGFDLVTAHYVSLPKAQADTIMPGLLGAVAPGGTLLFVAHEVSGHDPAHTPGRDPALYIQPDEIAAQLGREWQILVNETRKRSAPAGPGGMHTHDVVLRAMRKL